MLFVLISIHVTLARKPLPSQPSILISIIEALQQFEGGARAEALLFGLAVVDVALVLFERVIRKARDHQQKAVLLRFLMVC